MNKVKIMDSFGLSNGDRLVRVMLTLGLSLGSLQSSPAQDPANLRPALIKNVPFTAVQWTTKTTFAADGTKTVTTQRLDLARSSAGIVRREVHEATPGELRTLGSRTLTVSIVNNEEKVSTASFQNATAVTSVKMPSTRSTASVPTATSSDSSQATLVTLGDAELEGLKVVGHKSFFTAPALVSGATPTAITSETWYSPSLSMVVRSSLVDSANNSTVTVLTDIQRREPDAALFSNFASSN